MTFQGHTGVSGSLLVSPVSEVQKNVVLHSKNFLEQHLLTKLTLVKDDQLHLAEQNVSRDTFFKKHEFLKLFVLAVCSFFHLSLL